jgi:hypothetical protein
MSVESVTMLLNATSGYIGGQKESIGPGKGIAGAYGFVMAGNGIVFDGWALSGLKESKPGAQC